MNSENRKINNPFSKSGYSKTSLILLIIAPLFILTPLVIYLEQTQEFFLFPENAAVSCYPYADGSLEGNSRIIHFEQGHSEIIFKYQFGNAFESPFTGLTFMADPNKAIKLKDYSQIYLNMESDFPRISLYIKYYIPGYSVKDAYLSYNTKEAIFSSSPDNTNYTINLEAFSTPSWWYEMNGLSKDIEPADKSIPLDYEISIGFNGLTGNSNIYTLIINQISLKKDYTIIGIISIIFLAGYYVALIFLSKKKQVPNLDSQSTEQVIRYLSDNFNQPGLRLKMAAKELGIPPKTIEQLLYTRFRRDFKTYISDLKLEKAKEILVNTNNHISEIAYFLGFKYPSYFNRIFHGAFGLSPREYRKQKREIHQNKNH